MHAYMHTYIHTCKYQKRCIMSLLLTVIFGTGDTFLPPTHFVDRTHSSIIERGR